MKYRAAGWSLAVLLLLILPRLVTDSYYMYVIDLILLYSILALGQDLVTGYAGQVSLGHGAFYGVGAYVAAIATVDLHYPFWLILLAGPLVAGLMGLLLGLTAPRLQGDYLVMSTLAFGVLFWLVTLNWVDVTRGPMGIPGVPAPAPLHLGSLTLRFDDYWTYYYLLLGGVALVAFLTQRIVHSRFGRACLGIREDEVAAELLGVHLSWYKVMMMGLSAACTGLGGVLFAHFVHVVSPESFGFNMSVLILTMVLIGGMGSISGAIIGAALLTVLSEALRSVTEYRMIIYGLLLAVMIVFFPHGIVGTLRRQWTARGAAAAARKG